MNMNAHVLNNILAWGEKTMPVWLDLHCITNDQYSLCIYARSFGFHNEQVNWPAQCNFQTLIWFNKYFVINLTDAHA